MSEPRSRSAINEATNYSPPVIHNQDGDMTMADDFDYIPSAAPLPKVKISFNDLILSMKPMKAESVPFIGGLYGDPGFGKTTAAMELMQGLVPEDKKILYVFTGANWSSLMNRPELMRRTLKMRYTSNDQLESLGEMLLSEDYVKATGIGGVVFDEYNTMYDIELDKITDHNASIINNGPQRKDPKTGLRVYKDPSTPQWPDYNMGKSHLISLMNNVLNTDGIHFLFVCHPRTQAKRGNIIEPDFPDKSAQAFLRQCHSLFYLENSFQKDGSMKRVINLMGSDQFTAKNRIGGLPNKIENITEVVTAYHKWGVTEDEPEVVVPAEVKVASKGDPVPVVDISTGKTLAPKGDQDLLAEMLG